jgi:hypothetical protein
MQKPLINLKFKIQNGRLLQQTKNNNVLVSVDGSKAVNHFILSR